jgi:type IV secretion system protein VirD4
MTKGTKIFLFLSASFWISWAVGFSLACLIRKSFDIRYLFSKEALGLSLVLFGILIALILYYAYSHYWLNHSKDFLKGKEGDKHLRANLEDSRFQTEGEIEKNYVTIPFSELKQKEIVGSLIRERETEKGLEVTFAKPNHVLVIGTTGSGKTTTYVSPSIQILSELKNKPSMLISDPKGELFADHSEALKAKGYEVKVLDLRNPYNSVRWNPLEKPYLLYQRALHLEEEAIANEERGCYEFDGNEYWSLEEKDSAVQVKKQTLLDQVYEDLNDICTALCPVTNKEEPMWESGAKNFILAIALAMLEDSADPNSGMTKKKYNFYSLMKVATATDDDCAELVEYFRHRSPLSKAVSLSRQVMDASDKTRASYLSSAFDKISMFADLSLCALTSTNEIEFGSMGERPIALFLQIPDEKETRHTLASMVILQAYKELVYKANSYPELTLPKPVYFILDEFGNLPKVHKLEQMVTVGRSRNIWLNLIVQSYSQLAKVYDEKSADIIKSNCNIQVFIGTTDLKTIEDFSKRCGNYSIVQRSVGFNSVKGEDVSSNSQIRERPLIYPSELQTLNRPGDMGHAIVTIFGYHPIRSEFMPCFKVREFSMKRVDQKLSAGRWFDEEGAYYDLRKRNSRFKENQGGQEKGKQTNIAPPEREEEQKAKFSLMTEQAVREGLNAVDKILSAQDKEDLEGSIRAFDARTVSQLFSKALQRAKKLGNTEKEKMIDKARKRFLDLIAEEGRTPLARK